MIDLNEMLEPWPWFKNADKPKRKYQKENQGWIIKSPHGYIWNDTYNRYRQVTQMDAQDAYEAVWGERKTWKQLYNKGYRAVKVEVTEIEDWG